MPILLCSLCVACVVSARSPTPAAAAFAALHSQGTRKRVDPSHAAVQQAQQVSSVTPLILQLKQLRNRGFITQLDYDTVAKHALLLEGPSGGGKQYVLEKLQEWVDAGKLTAEVYHIHCCVDTENNILGLYLCFFCGLGRHGIK